jgi:hypothetical protein
LCAISFGVYTKSPARANLFCTAFQFDFAFEYIEGFRLRMVHVKRRSAAGRLNAFDDTEGSIGRTGTPEDADLTLSAPS